MPILGARLHVPVPRHELVVRPRLTDAMSLGEGPAPRLVLIAAPAGFGKTTLMTQWLTSTGSAGHEDVLGGPRVAWLSLDPTDADVRRFLSHVIAALQSATPEVGADASTLLATDNGTPVEDALVSLVNDLEILAGPTVLALDDYHVIDAAPVHDALRFLLDNLPTQVTLAMTTRADPPLPLARLRARGELLEIRAADLRFTSEEAGTFLNGVMGLGLDPSHVAALEERTEGWAAGLQLAALSARAAGGTDADRSDRGGFIDAFAGSHRFVLDYLVEEVLDKQPEQVRAFLLTTAVLDQLTASLCDALTGRDVGQAMLESLERANLFVVPLDDERRWWRYHHLFADALRARVISQDPGEVSRLHRLAARWYVQAGMLEDAMPHAVAGGDCDQIADLVELALPGLRARREDRRLGAFLQAVPEEAVRRSPLLATHYAWVPLSRGRLDDAAAWLDVAAAALLDPPPDAYAAASSPAAQLARARDSARREVPAMLAMYRASIAQARGDVAATTAYAQQVLELAADTDHMSRAAGFGFLGLAAWADGDVTTALDTFGQAVRSMHDAGTTADELGATVVLAGMWFANGRPDVAQRLYEDAIEAASRHEGPPLTTVADLHVGLAGVLRERGDLAAADQQLRTARDLGERATLPENRHRWYTVMAAVHRARGELDEATRCLEAAEPLYQAGFFPEVEPIPAQLARVRIEQGRLLDAQEWVRRHAVTLDGAPDFRREYEVLTLVRLMLAEQRTQGQPAPTASVADVVEALGQVVSAAGAVGRVGSLVEAHLLRALAAQVDGDLDTATDQLRVALRLGAPPGYRRRYLDEGVPTQTLLSAVAEHPVWPEAALARDVLRAAEPVAPPAAGPAPETGPDVVPPVEALSERELEVLRLLATDLTGPDIARRLYVSVNTLRTHTKHIFTKLDVNTRRAAVRRAGELGLL